MAISSIFLNNTAPTTLAKAALIASKPMIGMGQTAPSILPSRISEPMKKSYDGFTDWLAIGMGKVAGHEKSKKFIKYFETKRYPEHLSALFANIQNLFYMYDVANSKKIEENQKKPLMLNMFISTLLSTAGGYLLNDALIKKSNKVIALIEKNYKDSDHIVAGYKVAQALLVFQLLYRFVAPVIATPIANHISNKIREKNVNLSA